MPRKNDGVEYEQITLTLTKDQVAWLRDKSQEGVGSSLSQLGRHIMGEVMEVDQKRLARNAAEKKRRAKAKAGA